ncbi:phage tail tape measure protein [Pseudomonas aeruginosa]|nr:phage tail tape measure protein [Pseudomonas aeruginosa]
MAESKYSLRLAAVDAFSKTFGDFSKKAGELEEDIKATRSEISKLNGTARDVSGYVKLEGQLGKTKVMLQQARVEQASLGRAHTEAAAKVEQLGVEYVAASTALKKLESATEASAAEVSKARAEQQRLGSALAGATAEVKKLETAQDKNTASVRTLESAQRAEANQLKRLETALTGAGVDTAKLATEQKRLESATEQANAALQAQRARLDAVRQAQGRIEGNRAARADLRGQMVETAAIGYMAAKPVAQAMELEVAMADVAKVIKFEGNQREEMSNANLKLASDRLISSGGITAVDLAKIQYAAGQSGIGNDEKTSEGKQRAVMEFTRDAAIMGGAFDLGAEEAGSIMAGWRASMGLDREKTLDLANATNHLGNSFNATPADIASVVKRYGAVGQASGLKPEQSAALSAALLNPGTEKEIAGTGMKNFLAALTKGSAATKGQREAWSSLGMDPEDLAKQMQQDAPGTIMDVLQAIKAQPVEEQSALATQLFGSESIGAIMPMLQNLGEVERAFKMVANSADRAGSMMTEAEGKANTARGGWDAFVARLTRLSTLVGNAMLPALNATLVPLGALVDGMSWFAETFPMITSGLAVAAGGLAALKVGALGLKFVGLMVGQAFNRAGLARAKLDATTFRSATTADAAVLRLNAAMARLGAGGMGGADAGGRRGRGGRGGRGGGRGLGGKLAGVAGRGAAPLVLAAGAMNLASVISDGGTGEEIGGAAGSTAGGLGGMWAGAALGATVGSVVPVVGTAAGGLIGGAIGGLAGSSAGEWIGEKLGALVDKLSSPEATAKEIVTNTDNRQTTFAPVINIQGADHATSQALGDSIMQRMKAEMLPMMAMDPLAVRRGAALTDGSN